MSSNLDFPPPLQERQGNLIHTICLEKEVTWEEFAFEALCGGEEYALKIWSFFFTKFSLNNVQPAEYYFFNSSETAVFTLLLLSKEKLDGYG